MLRAIFMIGLFAMLGLFAVGMVFKLFGGLVGLTFFIVGLAIKVLIVGGLLYFGIRVGFDRRHEVLHRLDATVH